MVPIGLATVSGAAAKFHRLFIYFVRFGKSTHIPTTHVHIYIVRETEAKSTI